MKGGNYITLQELADNPADKLAVHPCAQKDVTAHGHDCFELAYIVEGTGEQTLNGVTESVKKEIFLSLISEAFMVIRSAGTCS